MRVLYICTGNSYRSPMAEALTRRYHPGLEVESAGVQPVEEIAEQTHKHLEGKNALKFVKPRPDRISQRALDEADRIVCMMPRHGEYIKRNFEVDPNEIEVWNIEDPVHPGKEPEEAFKEIEGKIRLINE